MERDREQLKLEAERIQQMSQMAQQQAKPPMPPQDISPEQVGPPMTEFPPEQMPS